MISFKTLYEAETIPTNSFKISTEALKSSKLPGAKANYDNGIMTSWLPTKTPLIKHYMITELKQDDYYLTFDIVLSSSDKSLKPSENSAVISAFVALLEDAGYSSITVRSGPTNIFFRAAKWNGEKYKTFLKLVKSLSPTGINKIFSSVYGKNLPLGELMANLIKSSKIKSGVAKVHDAKYEIDKNPEESFELFKKYMDSQKYESNSKGTDFKTWLVGYGRVIGARIENGKLIIK